MKISVRMEGGLGDHFAANRFIPAIKEYHPGCKIDLWSDTEGNSIQSDILREIWPDHFNDVFVLEKKKYKNFRIKSSNFPEEDYRGSIKNVRSNDIKLMKGAYDKFYDLHIDSLDWLNHDYDWFKYFNVFPRPTTSLTQNIELPFEKFILAHLYARDDADSNMEDWYIKRLINDVTKDFNLIILYDNDSKHKYEDFFGSKNPKLHLIHADLRQIFYLASKCTAMFGIDSGIRYIPYHFGKPTFTFSKYCQKYGTVQYSYLIRWLFNERYVFPLHYDVSSASQIIKNMLVNPAYKLYPFLLDDIESLVAQRDITEYITE
jgi:ADP-heptose:LPS heptosyltransferase